jgi:hypothetical protein
MKKQYFMLVDTETTQDQLVADFSAVICDRKGKIYSSCAVLVDGIFTDSENHPLFFDSTAPAETLWSRETADKRYSVYNEMVKNGSRMVASVAGINSWILKAVNQYNPTLTAYNLPFDLGKCLNTGIDFSSINGKFCLMAVAQNLAIKDRQFLQFCLDNHFFGNRTKFGNMVFQMKAETLGNYINGTLDHEPHTALEDVIYWEIPILKWVFKKLSLRKIMNTHWSGVAWQNRQVRDFYKVK